MRHSTLLIFSVLALSADAQDYLANEPIWNVRSICVVPVPCIATSNHNYLLVGDSVINGSTWSKVQEQGSSTLNWQGGEPGAGYTGAGLFGHALNLDGVQGSYAQQPINNTAFDLGSGDFTIQVWANLNSLSNVSGLNPVLIEKFSGASGPGWVFYVQQGSTIEFYSNGSLLLNPYESITLHVWHNYLVQRIGNTLNLFFDGSLVATTSFSRITGGQPKSAADRRTKCGRWEELYAGREY